MIHRRASTNVSRSWLAIQTFPRRRNFGGEGGREEGKILIRHRDGRNIIENYPVDGGVVTRITPTVINMA